VKVFLDTSVLVASVAEEHESHERAAAVLEDVHSGKNEGTISSHSLAEIYSVLTKLPSPMRHSPEQALLSIEENVVKYFKVTSLSGDEYRALIRDAAFAGIQGGTIYDALLLRCAEKANVERIFTLNLRHFQNVAPRSIISQIVAP